MGIWSWLTGKDKQNEAAKILQQSVDLTKETTNKINNNYQGLLDLFNKKNILGGSLDNLNNLGNTLLSSLGQFKGPDANYVQSQQKQVNEVFDSAQKDQSASLANMGFNPNDKVYNKANAELASSRGNALAGVTSNATNQAFNNYLQGAGMYGNLQQSLLNSGLGVNNAWSNALIGSLGSNVGANNALSALYDKQSGNNMAALGGLMQGAGSLLGGVGKIAGVL
mgnify:CR=1 FL=1